MANVVIDRDRGWASIKANLRELNGMAAAVGILDDTDSRTDKGEIGNAGIMAVHEFGSPEHGIPERSPIRSTIDEHAREYTKLGKELASGVSTGALSARSAHELLGERVRSDIKRAIQAGIPPPLKDATIRRKKSSKQLIDTAQMLNAVTYEVRRT